GLKVKNQPELESKLRSFNDLEAVTITVDWVLRTALGDSLRCDVQLHFADDASAATGREAVLALRGDVRKAIKQLRDVLKQPQAAKESAFALLMEINRKVLIELDTALQEADVGQRGHTVHVPIRLRFDIVQWFAAVM